MIGIPSVTFLATPLMILYLKQFDVHVPSHSSLSLPVKLLQMTPYFFLELFNCLVVYLKLEPPWKPDVKDAADTKYIPEEFAREPVELTPPEGHSVNSGTLDSIAEESEMPYFEQFSYHGGPGSRGSYGSYLSPSAAMSEMHI